MRWLFLVLALSASSAYAGRQYQGVCYETDAAAVQAACEGFVSTVLPVVQLNANPVMMSRPARTCTVIGASATATTTSTIYTVSTTTGALTAMSGGSSALAVSFNPANWPVCTPVAGFSAEQLSAELQLFGAMLAALAAIWGVRRLYYVFNSDPREA